LSLPAALRFAPKALWVFVGLGVLQSARSLLSFFGLQKIGTSQSQPRRNTYPLWSALFVISFMNEQAGPAVLGGTMLVVLEVALISWQPDRKAIDCCGWHVLYSLGAGILAGVAFPLRLCSLTITKEPVFFAAIVAVGRWCARYRMLGYRIAIEVLSGTQKL
jgi:drug/metabolite transporter (DMT)-like permease